MVVSLARFTLILLFALTSNTISAYGLSLKQRRQVSLFIPRVDPFGFGQQSSTGQSGGGATNFMSFFQNPSSSSSGSGSFFDFAGAGKVQETQGSSGTLASRPIGFDPRDSPGSPSSPYYGSTAAPAYYGQTPQPTLKTDPATFLPLPTRPPTTTMPPTMPPSTAPPRRDYSGRLVSDNPPPQPQPDTNTDDIIIVNRKQPDQRELYPDP